MSDSESGENFGGGSIGSALVLQSAADSHFRCFAVLIDGKPAGTIYRGDSERYPLAPGDHDLVVHTGFGGDSAWTCSRWMNRFYDRYYSPRISFVVKPDADCEATCGSNWGYGKSASRATQVISGLLCGILVLLVCEIQNAWFPQYPFSLGKVPDALIFFLILASSPRFAKFIVFEQDGPVWCKLK